MVTHADLISQSEEDPANFPIVRRTKEERLLDVGISIVVASAKIENISSERGESESEKFGVKARKWEK